MMFAVIVFLVAFVLVSTALSLHVYENILRDRYREPVTASEIHSVVTEDGWTIFLHRRKPSIGRGEPVFFCHGLATNHFNLLLPQHESIGDALLNAGYDCWHVDLRACRSAVPPSGVSHLDATLDDLLLRDIPAALQHIAEVTGYDKVHWVGHSMGGMLLYAYELRFGTARLASAVTLGAPIGFGGVRHKGLPFQMAIVPYIHRFMADAFRAMAPLAANRRLRSRWLPINWENTSPRIGAAELYYLMELPLPRIGGQMDSWAATQTWTMCGGELDVPPRLRELQSPARS